MAVLLSLSLRQLVLQRRYLVVLLLAAAPAAVAAISTYATPGGADEQSIGNLLDQMVVTVVLPIAVLIAGTTALGLELEDKTIAYLVLKPIARWSIVLPKLAAVVIASGVPVILGTVIAIIVMAPAEIPTAAGVAFALLIGVALYGSLFLVLGLLTQHALPFGLVYMVLWEGAVAQFLVGGRYLSIRQYTLTFIDALTPVRLVPAGSVVELPAAILGSLLFVTIFTALAVFRLRRMDFP